LTILQKYFLPFLLYHSTTQLDHATKTAYCA